MNLNSTIIPRSDQTNAEDLLSGPRTIRITSVVVKEGEQPVSVHYEGDNGRPYKPSKTARRLMVMMWGGDGDAYVGKRLTLFRDPTTPFGGQQVGGIMISHASDIAEPISVSLSVSRGKRKPYRVDPLPADTTQQDGDEAAKLGMEKLKAFFVSLSASQKAEYKSMLETTWKPEAEKADKARATT